MLINFKPAGEPGTRTESSYHITPATISITGNGRLSVAKDLEAVLRKIEYWHQATVEFRQSLPQCSFFYLKGVSETEIDLYKVVRSSIDIDNVIAGFAEDPDMGSKAIFASDVKQLNQDKPR